MTEFRVSRAGVCFCCVSFASCDSDALRAQALRGLSGWCDRASAASSWWQRTEVQSLGSGNKLDDVVPCGIQIVPRMPQPLVRDASRAPEREGPEAVRQTPRTVQFGHTPTNRDIPAVTRR